MDKNKILIVSAWAEVIDSVLQVVEKEATAVVIPLREIKTYFQNNTCDMVVLALPSVELEQTQSILEIHGINDALPVILITDNQDWEVVVRWMKLGIQEYLLHPVAEDKLEKIIQHYVQLYHRTKRIYKIDDPNSGPLHFEGMVGSSPKMLENFKMIQSVSKSNATVLITGESGTGKELVAKAIHRQSNRAKSRFVDLNCGAIPRDLLENELFGHERGSFTGAHKRYQGSFEAAHHGTLFLDEISEMDPLLQVKLLRVLQERSFMRIGGTARIDVDVRIVAATNRNLEDFIAKGLFREDLYYRLNVVNIQIPALRERRKDIPLLAHTFLEFYSAKNDRIFLDFSSDALEALINYEWPGNVRELENTIERVVVLHNDSQVKLKFLPKQIQKVTRSIQFSDIAKENNEENRIIPLIELERRAIELALIKFHGSVAIAAKKLKIGVATMYRKMKQYGLTQDRE